VSNKRFPSNPQGTSSVSPFAFFVSTLDRFAGVEFDDFCTVGTVELSNSGKTVEIYFFTESGKRYFIGQIPCNKLQKLLDRTLLKINIVKCQNIQGGNK